MLEVEGATVDVAPDGHTAISRFVEGGAAEEPDIILMDEGGVQALTPEGLEAVYAQVRVPRYRRSFTLSRELDTTRIEASLKDGVPTLRIPKQAHASRAVSP